MKAKFVLLVCRMSQSLQDFLMSWLKQFVQIQFILWKLELLHGLIRAAAVHIPIVSIFIVRPTELGCDSQQNLVGLNWMQGVSVNLGLVWLDWTVFKASARTFRFAVLIKLTPTLIINETRQPMEGKEPKKILTYKRPPNSPPFRVKCIKH